MEEGPESDSKFSTGIPSNILVDECYRLKSLEHGHVPLAKKATRINLVTRIMPDLDQRELQ